MAYYWLIVGEAIGQQFGLFAPASAPLVLPKMTLKTSF
jgi:hypothetical protein